MAKEEEEEAEATYLIRFIKQTQPVAHPERINVISLAALAELVRLDILLADDLLRHNTAVPVPANTLLPWRERENRYISSNNVRNCPPSSRTAWITWFRN